MFSRKGILIIIFTLLVLPAFAQKYNKADTSWANIDTLVKNDLPASALELAEKRYAVAKKRGHEIDQLKAAAYIISLRTRFQEDALEKNVIWLRDEIKGAEFPVKNILISFQLRQFDELLVSRGWERIQGTLVEGPMPDSDINSWTRVQFYRRVDSLVNEMLKEEKKLQQLPARRFSPVLSKGEDGPQLTPTLYDLLARSAISVYTIRLSLLHDFEQQAVDPAFLLYPLDDYMKVNTDTAASLDPAWKKITQLFQSLLRFHIKEGNADAVVDADLYRLGVAFDHINLSTKKTDYEQALAHLEVRFANHPAAAAAGYQRASFILREKYLPAGQPEGMTPEKLALQICEKYISKFPDSYGGKNCKWLKAEITAASLSVPGPEILQIPGQPFLVQVKYKNFSKLHYRIYKVDEELMRLWNLMMERQYGPSRGADSIVSSLAGIPLIAENAIELKAEDDYQDHEMQVNLPAQPLGRYIILFSKDASFRTDSNVYSLHPFIMSHLRVMTEQGGKDGLIKWFVRDAKSGKGIRNAEMEISISRGYGREIVKNALQFKSGKEGEVVYKIEERERGKQICITGLRKGADTLSELECSYLYYYPQEDKKKRTLTFYFTDRSIYRPGQTIYFKGIVTRYTPGKNDQEILTDYHTTVRFIDANEELVSKQEVATNEFGSFSGSFTIPDGLLNGRMRLEDENGAAYFSVEEYKRPQFEITFEPVRTVYRLNDPVTLYGNVISYSGAPLSNITVQYSVMRQNNPFRYIPGNVDAVTLEHGTLETDADGNFSISFIAKGDTAELKEWYSNTISFQAEATATDVSGETHTATQWINVGKVSMNLEVETNKSWNKDRKNALMAVARNLNYREVKAAVKLKIEKLKEPERAYLPETDKGPIPLPEPEFHKLFPYHVYDKEDDRSTWPVEHTYIEREIPSNTDIEFSPDELKKLPQGVYRITLETVDSFGVTVKAKEHITVFDPDKRKPAANAFLIVQDVSGPLVKPGEKLTVLAGSAEKIYARITAELDYQLIYEEWVTLNNKQKKIEIDVPEQAKGRVFITVSTLVENTFLHETLDYFVKEEDRTLQIRTTVFRSKLRPGQQESWRFNIRTAEGKNPPAEMVAAMYDASLDQFSEHDWNMGFYHYSHRNIGISMMGVNQYRSFNNYRIRNPFKQYYREYDQLDAEIIPYLRYLWSVDGMSVEDNAYRANTGVYSIQAPLEGASDFKFTAANGNAKAEGGVPEEQKEEEEKPQAPTVQVRRNLQETAFFYPHLRTNDKGDVEVEFRIPESLTRWNFLGFAHSKDLYLGRYRQSVITQKELMVQPNAPRFLRVGDSAIFSVRISNMMPEAKEGYAELRILDPLTEKDITDQYLYDTKSSGQKIQLPASGNIAMRWALKIPEGSEGFIYRVTAAAGNFSDGEENMVPVLPQRVLVTESQTIAVRSEQTKEYTFRKLTEANRSKTLKPYRLELEVTSNPAWYAVQSMPYLMEYPYECAEQVFNRYYANAISKYIVDNNPAIQKVLKAWKASGGGSFMSMLEKNQELKAVLLQETPWVAEAKSEAEQKRRLAMLFDENTLNKELLEALVKLEQMQLPSGAFPWFSQMQPNRYITQYIVAGLGRLEKMNIRNEYLTRTRNIMTKAIAYMDREMVREYEKRDPAKANNLSPEIVSYLYARGFFKVPIEQEFGTAVHYWQVQAQKYYKGRSLMEKAMLAVAMRKWGHEKYSIEILNSIDDYALHSEEMGMYWKELNSGGIYWYQRPVETQALLIEAYKDILGANKDIEEMKIWLLKQKQTQSWESTKATADACYALLMTGDPISANGSLMKIYLGGELFDPATEGGTAPEAGSGYYSHTWTGSDIQPAMGKIKAVNSGYTIAWGALHFQYFEDLDKVESGGGPLKIEKQLYVKQMTDKGPVLKKLTKDMILKPGDLITVRLVITTDRNMEYIHLKDMRAAALEPVETLSGYGYSNGLGYYQSIKDASMNFFMDRLSRGTHVLEYNLRVNQAGGFSNGMAEIQCMYAPEFNSHSGSVQIQVKP